MRNSLVSKYSLLIELEFSDITFQIKFIVDLKLLLFNGVRGLSCIYGRNEKLNNQNCISLDCFNQFIGRNISSLKSYLSLSD